ncbi:hypothetical protein FV222_10865 [Methylobacterium sp. WL103]|uniref:hypothetical protein n=1 Tax=Methylobacterium sp. WL103 TaxID=2603891 RepID=UPI0011CB39BA|nr:hypothetical protein [Methylobacterium sp. WL103]TXN01282.1 hypothetical protein FV222_10865 [Methylobacterium sp. WL103]TXN15144.1 hypothetical protein FV219_02455 [Methylobacterium sp. WL122]
MSKRPSLIGGLSLPGAVPSAPAADKTADAPSAKAEGTSTGRKARPDVVHTSVYLPKEVHRRLREIAFTRDVKVHDVIMEGIDAALQRHGHPSVNALKPERKR